MRTIGWQEKHTESRDEILKEKRIAIELNAFRRRVALERAARRGGNQNQREGQN